MITRVRKERNADRMEGKANRMFCENERGGPGASLQEASEREKGEFLSPVFTILRLFQKLFIVNPMKRKSRVIMESCPSGLRSTLGKRVYTKVYRGFESPTFREYKKRIILY